MHPALVIAGLMSLSLLIATTTLHFEALHRLWRLVSRGKGARRTKIVVALVSIVVLHLVEIGLYAAVYALGAGPLHLGTFKTTLHMRYLDFIYYSAETYSTLGYGDIFPVGYLRIIAAVSPLNGSLLLASSGSFLFLLIRNNLGHESS